MVTSIIKVMVAEDFDLIREDLCELIRSQDDMELVGYASSGKEIEKLAAQVKTDIILMDIEMEKINAGIMAAEAIHYMNPEIKIIFLTAHETNEMVITAMATGSVDYIVKGIADEEVLKHIRSANEGQPLLEAKFQKTIMQEFNRLRSSERSLLFFINTISKLTPVERELVKLLLEGHKVAQIADIRCVEVVTVKTQIKSLLKKFGCSRTKEIVSRINELKVNHLF